MDVIIILDAGSDDFLNLLKSKLIKDGLTPIEADFKIHEIKDIISGYDHQFKVDEGFKELIEYCKPEKVKPFDLEQPKNYLHIEPPKQKKERRNQPDKRVLNRKKRK